MKRISAVFLLLALLVCAACTPEAATVEGVQTPEPASAQSDTPSVQPNGVTPLEPEQAAPVRTKLIDVFSAYEDLDDGETKATIFEYDLDNDGTAEPIAIEIDWEEDLLFLSVGDRIEEFPNSAALMTVYLCDLDPASSYRNLIVVADEASDDYVTAVLHPEGDALVIDRQIYGLVDWDAETEAFISYENTGLFGSNSGTRHYYGDAFEPDTEWLTCWMPSEEYLKEYRQNLFEGGYLLHLVRDLPCTVDGQPAILTAGNCILLVRYHESLTQAEVRTEDGSVYATVSIDFDPDEWQYRIDGVEQDEYFDNLFFAD